jgi:dihydropyrimidinase
MRSVIRGGTVVTATGEARADVLLDGERIAAVGELGELAAGAEPIDASGCYVLPGLIDNHTHLDMPFGGTVTADDFDTGTAAAAAGGTTTVIDFALQTDGSLLKGIETWQAKASGRAHIDYGFHIAVSDASPEALAEMRGAVDAGVTSFKVFMAYKGVLMASDDQLLRILQQAGEVGGLVMVHAENGDVIDVLVEQALAAGNTAPRYHAATRPPEVEAEATGRAIRLARLAGQELFVVHVTCEGAVSEIERGRADGAAVTGETCLQYLVLDVDELARPGFEGAKYVCSPPLRPREHQDVLWRALARGALGICSTDHAPFNYAGQKELGRDSFAAIPNGLPVIEHRLALLHDRGVRAGRITISDLVRITATEPARRFGLAGRKGEIAPGADADLVIFDPEAEQVISAAEQVMNVDYTPFEGWVVRGRPRLVLSRGTVVARDGKPAAAPGYGRFLARAPLARTSL